jgi:hypothetical protein
LINSICEQGTFFETEHEEVQHGNEYEWYTCEWDSYFIHSDGSHSFLTHHTISGICE